MKSKQIMAALLAGGLTLATSLKADHPPNAQLVQPPPGQARPPAQPCPPALPQADRNTQKPRRAETLAEQSYWSVTHIIGRQIRDAAGEYLGTVQDLIVNLDTHTAPVAIMKSRGTLGIGRTRVAVPLQDLKWSGDKRDFSLAATKEQMQSASPTPSGGWAFAANQDWAKKVDLFYGDPGKFELSQFVMPGTTELDDSREFVRDSAQPNLAIEREDQPATADGGSKLTPSTSADSLLQIQVNQIIGLYASPVTGSDVQAVVQGGVVTLKGRVAATFQKSAIESRIKDLSGVSALFDDQLSATK
jgi:sporulation protein YlmC with PRC-barrel domain